MNIFNVIRQGKSVFLFAQLLLGAFYRRLGKQLGIEPGAEMVAAIERARRDGRELVLADREIEITLKRVWGGMGFWKRMDMVSQMVASLFVREKIDEKTIEDLKQRDQLDAAMEQFAEAFPGVKQRLIDERDRYLAEKIRTAPGECVVAVVGAGHVKGIQSHIATPQSLEELNALPAPSLLPKILKWVVPLSIVALLVAGFFKKGDFDATSSIGIWVVVNGSLAALGALVALAHPLTIIASFLAAPITTLHPMIGAGMVAGLVQAWVKKPTVADLEELADAVTTVKGFWRNPMSRILLVVVTVSLGAMAGTFISGGMIAARLF
jgi:pheromone shutdown-related protein TraB